VTSKSCLLWGNVRKYTAGHITENNVLRRMRIAWWVPKTTNTALRIWNFYWFSTATVVRRTRLTVTFYVHFLLCLRYNIWGMVTTLRMVRDVIEWENLFWINEGITQDKTCEAQKLQNVDMEGQRTVIYRKKAVVTTVTVFCQLVLGIWNIQICP